MRYLIKGPGDSCFIWRPTHLADVLTHTSLTALEMQLVSMSCDIGRQEAYA